MRISDWSSDVCSSDLTVISEALNILGQSLRKSYLSDLILRHTKAVKSQTARASGGSVGLANQLNTIRLNPAPVRGVGGKPSTEEHTSELQSLMRMSYAVFCLGKKKRNDIIEITTEHFRNKGT